ncbi:MAG: alpha/beta hydrolase [Bacteroidetes bacterium]|nr:alpha/beta hydrolase [Bacteroidota bacterium]
MTFHDLFKLDIAIERDIRYLPGENARHLLDVYAPRNAAGLPVVLFFYGGGWRSGDKRLFEHLGRAFAARGIIAVTVNYRLTPAVRSPAHTQDCAAALQWAYSSIAGYGGNPEAIFLSGHSAGGHLGALVTMDERYLAEVGLAPGVVRGCVIISGATDLRLHSETTVYTAKEYIEQAFGSTQEELAAASPIAYVRSGLPPFLVIVAELDPPGLREQGRRFADSLRDAGNDVRFMSVKGRDHFSIVRRFGPSDDATCGAMVDFIKHYAR